VEQAVILHFQYGSTDLWRLFELEDRLADAIAAAKVGEIDGHEIAMDGSDGFYFMYGPDADRLLSVVLPVLKSSDFMKGAEVRRQYGPPGSNPREVVTTIDE
jgi:hypothetical protein